MPNRKWVEKLLKAYARLRPPERLLSEERARRLRDRLRPAGVPPTGQDRKQHDSKRP